MNIDRFSGLQAPLWLACRAAPRTMGCPRSTAITHALALDGTVGSNSQREMLLQIQWNCLVNHGWLCGSSGKHREALGSTGNGGTDFECYPAFFLWGIVGPLFGLLAKDFFLPENSRLEVESLHRVNMSNQIWLPPEHKFRLFAWEGRLFEQLHMPWPWPKPHFKQPPVPIVPKP